MSASNRAVSAVAAAIVAVTAALIVYANTAAFAWDEGYHLIAAWLIAHGKQPYIDFIFPQTPLNAYWNSALLRLLGESTGESWRVPHTVASLLTAGAVTMTATYVYRRLDAPPAWRASAAIGAAIVMGLNTVVMEFGSLQAYGMCLFMTVAAYMWTISAVRHQGILRPLAAGLCAGIAASSSLLSAPFAPILLIWMLIVSEPGTRTRKFVGFSAGVAVAFIPLLRLLMQAPQQVLFGFLKYELIYRKVEWDDAGTHNLGEFLSFGDSSQAVLLVLLAVAGIVYIRRSDVARTVKAELYLCGTLALVIGCYLLTARPTFTRYYLLTVPFLAMPAARGLYEVTKRLTDHPRGWLAALILCSITAYGLAASLFEQRDDMMWHDMEQLAAKVREVTPANAVLLADEPVYFLLRRIPPTGMELEDSHKLKLPDSEMLAQHVVARAKLDIMIKAGRFDTVEMCDDDEIARIDLDSLYSSNATAGTCRVFWNRVSAKHNP